MKTRSNRILSRRLLRLWSYLNSNQLLKSLVDDLLKSDETVVLAIHLLDQTRVEDALYRLTTATERTHAEVACNLLKLLDREKATIGDKLNSLSERVFYDPSTNNHYNSFKAEVVQSLCDYLGEKLAEQQAVFGTLLRYKWRSEFYNRQELADIAAKAPEHPDADDEGKTSLDPLEQRLKSDLNRYLHDQGIDFIIDPKLDRSMIDYLIQQDSTGRPILVEGKVYDGNRRNKSKVAQGVKQSYGYAKDYQSQCIYYVVYNTAERGIRFALPQKSISNAIQPIEVRGVTIYAMVVDIFLHDKGMSKRKQDYVDITDEDLKPLLGGNSA